MITVKDKKLLSEPYFNVLRETDQFIEVESINTGHCWSVQKVEAGKLKVKLWHKHNKDDYFHLHKSFLTVKQAIDEIKSHDEYVSQRGEKENV